MNLIDAFIVGAPKSGTTWLANTLNQNPVLEISNPKEANLIASHKGTFGRINDLPNWNEYNKYFKNNLFRIDASVHTFACPVSPKRIADKLPNMKFILCIREPVSRTFSHWNMVIDTKEDIRNGTNWSKFSVAWEDDRLRDDSLYGKSMKRWLEYFPLENFLIVDSARMKIEPILVLDEIEQFLSLDSYNYNIDLSKHANSAKNRNIKLSSIGKIVQKLFSLIPIFLKGPLVRRLQAKDINIYTNPLISNEIKINKITNSNYKICSDIVIKDLKLFEEITNFSTKHWIEEIEYQINQ